MSDKEKEDEDLPTACGTMYTHIDCDCGTVFDLEGDRDGETVECPDCGEKMIVRRT